MQDTAKTGLRGRRKTHTYTNRDCLLCAHAYTNTYTHADKCTHSDTYWLNRKTHSSDWSVKVLVCLPASMEIKVFHVSWFRGFLHLVVAIGRR